VQARKPIRRLPVEEIRETLDRLYYVVLLQVLNLKFQEFPIDRSSRVQPVAYLHDFIVAAHPSRAIEQVTWIKGKDLGIEQFLKNRQRVCWTPDPNEKSS